jgi:ribosome-binding factor A
MASEERINEVLHRELAEAITQEVEFPEGLITITAVDCSSDFSFARVFVSVLPDHLTGTALRALKKSSARVMARAKKHLKFRRIPKLRWSFDSIERDYEEIDKVMREIED